MLRTVVLKNDEPAVLRPIHTGDEPALREFHRRLSDRSVYQRYFHMLGLAYRTAPARLAAVCAPDPTIETVLVLVHPGGTPDDAIVGVGRLTCLAGGDAAEFAVVLADAWQGVGGGTVLLKALVDEANARGLRSLGADVLQDNVDMVRLCRACGFTVFPGPEPGVVRAEIALRLRPGG